MQSFVIIHLLIQNLCLVPALAYLAKDIKLIGVQLRAAKLMQGIGNLEYDERLTRLEKRKVRIDLIEAYKIINGNYNINSDLFDHDDNGLRGLEKKLFKRRFRLDVRKCFMQ